MTSWYSHESVLSEVFEWREKGNYCRVVSVGDRDVEGITERGLFKTAFRFVWPSVVRGQCGNRKESKKMSREDCRADTHYKVWSLSWLSDICSLMIFFRQYSPGQ